MDKGLNKFLQNACTQQANTVVGRICKQIEVLQNAQEKKVKELEKNYSSADETTRKKIEVQISELKQYVYDLSLLKNFNKEMIYEEFRDLRKAVIFYSEGREYQKIPIYNPTKEDNS